MSTRAWQANINRIRRQNALRSSTGRKRQFCATPEGEKVTAELFVAPLARFLRGESELQPTPPARRLAGLLSLLDQDKVALCALAPTLDGIFRGWDRGDPTLFTKVSDCVGAHLAACLRQELKIDALTDPLDRFRAGAWALDCATTMDYFDIDADGLPAIAADWLPLIEDCRQELFAGIVRRHPLLLPHLSPPPDWTGWHNYPEARLPITFVRDHGFGTQTAIEQAFRDPDWEHAKAVNALQRVPLEIDPVIADLVDRYAAQVMEHAGRKRLADHMLVDADLGEANYLIGKPFWLSYNCDTRGRVYAVQNLHYQRQDHVRAMFRFNHGMPLGEDGLFWLQIHCANCHGETEKLSWSHRLWWVRKHRAEIARIGNAPDPGVFFNEWRDVEKPFAYVAACRELARAWSDPEGFITHLPIPFDHTCSGYQHHALILRDESTGKLVNLTDTKFPQDVYSVIIDQVLLDLERDESELSVWWRERLQQKARKILKTPIMTHGYSVSIHGMAEQIEEAYEKAYPGGNQPPTRKAAFFLAKTIRKAVAKALPEPTRFMHWAREIAQQCSKEGRIVEWIGPTGFPCANRYHDPLYKTLNVPFGGIRIRRRVAHGSKSTIKKRKAADAIAPNYVHSLDAAHLIRVVNAAMREGMNDILTVHDSFAVHAPNAVHINKIIRRELGLMYCCYDAIGTLQKNAPSIEPPALGKLDPLDTQNAEWLCL